MTMTSDDSERKEFESALSKLPRYMRDTNDGRESLFRFWQAAREPLGWQIARLRAEIERLNRACATALRDHSIDWIDYDIRR
jgi:hypothetical protein